MTEHSTSAGADAAASDALVGLSLQASLTVADIRRSVAWYRDVVGFAVDREFARDGALMAVSLRAGSARILLTQDDGARGLNRVKGEGFSLSITTAEDLEEVARRMRAGGGDAAVEPTRFGSRIALQDPDGFRLVIMPPRPA